MSCSRLPSMAKFWRANRRDGRMPRDEQGWRVAPAPDGRGVPDPPATRPPHWSRPFVWFVALLRALNFGSVLLVRPADQPRVRVPFSPYFVSAVRDGRVASISSRYVGWAPRSGRLIARRATRGGAPDSSRSLPAAQPLGEGRSDDYSCGE